jgi:hypothetical protein
VASVDTLALFRDDDIARSLMLGSGDQTGLATQAAAPRNEPAFLHWMGLLVLLTLTGCSGTSVSPSPTVGAPEFSMTGAMAQARMSQTATLLQDGRVLIVGGFDGSQSSLASAELYNPKSGAFSATGPMGQARMSQTATLLPDGRVLIAGGYDLASRAYQASAELYDPTTGMFSATGSMMNARSEHAATLLLDGGVLITGGLGYTATGRAGTLASAELYDPRTGAFSAAGLMTQDRAGHTATGLSDGRILIAGGFRGDSSASSSSAELYDPGVGAFSVTGSMAEPRSYQTATALQDGRVLVVGGYDGSRTLASAELYDPRSRTFELTVGMSYARDHQTATLLADGRILIAGGYYDQSKATLTYAELFHP